MQECNLATSSTHWHSNRESVETGKQQLPSLQMLALEVLVGRGVEQFVEAIGPCILKNGKHMMQDSARCGEFSMQVLRLMLHCDASHCVATLLQGLVSVRSYTIPASPVVFMNSYIV